MEISDDELHAATHQIEEEHRSGMAAMPSQIAELREGEGARGRDERAQILSGKRRGGLALGQSPMPKAFHTTTGAVAPGTGV